MDLEHAIVRTTTTADRAQVSEIVRSNPKMYGSDITQFHQYMIERCLWQPKNELEQTRWCVEVDGQLIGLSTQFWWTVSPSWSIGGLFFRNQEGRNQFNAVKIGALLVNGMIEAAEKRSVYEFFYIVRDSGHKRLDMSLAVNDKLHRYEIVDVALVKPREIPRFPAHQRMLGLLAGKNQKPVVIRHALLKNEHRPSVW